MSNIKISASINLKKEYYQNIIYMLSEDEKDTYYSMLELLNEDYGFLDIKINFVDYYKVQQTIESIPANLDKKVLSNIIIRQYLLYKLLKESEIDTYVEYEIPIENFADSVFCGDYNKIRNTKLLMIDDVYEKIKEKAKSKPNPYARIHFLINDVSDEELQKGINDLFFCRSSISMIGYTTHNLLTYETTKGLNISQPNDFTLIASEKKMDEMKKEGRRR